MKPVVVFDIDGTLANISERRLHLEGSNPDRSRFNGEMSTDVPNLPVVELYKTLWESGRYSLILTSGRNERHRKFTENWLFWNEINYHVMYMRPDADNRADHEIKREFLEAIRRDHGEVLFAVDDRDQVVAMWRRNGVTCLQCAEGDF
ncbi:hypothetical protein ACCS45_03920 [Rhizobium ruizarguesonis]